MGATYALSGNLQKISHYIFLLTPHTVGVSGDVPEYQDSMGAAPVTKTF
jgi:cell division inhibitor SepF